MLNELRDTLLELEGFDEDTVFYGLAKKTKATENLWNYIVFYRDVMKPTENNNSYTYYYDVVIVQEEYIPESMIEDVIRQVETTKLRLASEPPRFDYRKKEDGTIVEILTIHFREARKKRW